MTKTLKDLMVKEAVEENLKKHIASRGISPNYFTFFKLAEIGLGNALNIKNIPSVLYMDDTGASSFSDNMEAIKTWLILTGKTLGPIIKEYETLTNDYQKITTRIANEVPALQDRLDRLLSPLCYYISPRVSDQTSESNCGKIGKFITLPFFASTAKVYNGRLSLKAMSTGDIVFSNTEKLRRLPMANWIAMKVSGGKEESVTLNGTLSEAIDCNAFYLKLMNDVSNIRLSLISSGGEVTYTKEFKDNELFANFAPVSMASFSINIKYNNPNTDKPFAIQLSSIEIFEKIQFARTGTFESAQRMITGGEEANSLGIEYENLGDIEQTNIKNLISISTDSEVRDYNIVDTDSMIDISVHKARHHKTYSQLGAEADTTVNIKYPDDNSERLFYKMNIDPLDLNFWNMNFDTALVFHGLPTEYSRTTQFYSSQPELIYENWTKVGNYWKTMVVVYENNVLVDIGKNTIKVNGRERTGKVHFEKGISLIEVHKKYIDFRLGQVSATDLDVTNQTRIQSDPLFPYNFIYMFSGLPDFTTDGTLAMETDRVYDVSEDQTSTIILGEPFLPLTMDIVDSNSIPYDLVLTNGVYEPGTYSVEPFGGKVRVRALPGATTITVTYRRANPFRRAIGIMFNRLLTFMPIKTLLGLSWRDDMFFSLDGSQDARFLLLQDIPDKTIAHSQLIYNRLDENIYSSIRLEMETKNRYLTPIIKDMFITVG
jgi:hypothetical protein